MKKVLLALALLAGLGSSPGRANAGVADEIGRQIRATLPADLAAVSIAVPPSIASLDGEVAVEWYAAPRPGRVSVRVRVSRGGRVREGWAQVELARPRPVPVAARDLPAGAVLGAADLRIEARAVAGGWDVTPAALAGARLVRPLAAGQPIVEQDVAAAAPVSAGTPVTVSIKSGALTVSAGGVLERPARPGEQAAARVGGRLVRGRLAADRSTLLVETP